MAFLKLIRYKNLLMILLTMMLTKYAILKTSILSDFHFILLTFSVILITAGGYIINDIYDLETDKINKPKNIQINNVFSIKTAWKYYLFLSLIGLFLGGYISFQNTYPKDTFFYFICAIILLFLYSKYLKKIAFIGNLIVAILTGLSIYILLPFEFLTEDILTDYSSSKNIIISYACFAFITTIIREIIKDIEDIDGDLKINARTLPIIIGRKRASKISFFISCILLLFLILILQIIQKDILLFSYGITFILLPLLYFLYRLWFSEKRKDYSFLSQFIKIIMLFGILSMLLFKLS